MNFGNFSLLLLLCLFTFQIGLAQELTTNENGAKIIVYPDGSWKYAEESEIEELEGNKKPIMSVIKAKAKPKSDLDIAIIIAETAAAEETEAKRIEEEAKFERMQIEDELEEAENSDDFFENEIDEIRDRLKNAKKEEKKAKSNRKKATKKAKNTSSLLAMDAETRAKELKKYDTSQIVNDPSSVKENEPVTVSSEDAIPNEETSNLSTDLSLTENQNQYSKKVFAKYDPKKDVLFNPPTQECNLAFDGVDEFSGKKRKDVAEQLFFTHTNKELRSVFKDRDYMRCTGYLSSLSGGVKFLTLNLTIASKSAQREYGILEKGALINIKLLNGDNVKLVNSKTSLGIENPLENSVTYRAQYIVSSGDEKQLKKSEIDKVRIIWSSGYEDYEIYELDFFKTQFKCLDR